eukprot:scaffold9564_cov85-Phaeocystis_antarctica.AAC.2
MRAPGVYILSDVKSGTPISDSSYRTYRHTDTRNTIHRQAQYVSHHTDQWHTAINNLPNRAAPRLRLGSRHLTVMPPGAAVRSAVRGRRATWSGPRRSAPPTGRESRG